MAASNSNRLLLIGVLVFVIGVVLVLLVFWGLNNDDEPTQVVTEGPTGSSQPQPQPTFTGAPRLLPVPLEVPTDMEGVAVNMTGVRGLVSVPIPGDRVNIYRLQDLSEFLKNPLEDPAGVPVVPGAAVLLHADIEVLGNAGTPGNADSAVFVISVDPADVPSLLPLIETGQLWFSLLPPVEEATESPA